MKKSFGKLRWEGERFSGIRVEILAGNRLRDTLSFIFFVAWTSLSFSYMQVVISQGDEIKYTDAVIFLGVLGLIYFAGKSVWSCTGRTIVYLDSRQLRVERRAVGIQWDTQIFQVGRIYAFRYVSAGSLYRFRIDTDVRRSAMEFRVGKKVYRFARGIADSDARKLLALANDVVEIPAMPPVGDGTRI